MLFLLLLPQSFGLVNWKQLAGQRRRRSRPAQPTMSCSSSNIMTDLTVMKQDMFGLFYKTPPAYVPPALANSAALSKTYICLLFLVVSRLFSPEDFCFGWLRQSAVVKIKWDWQDLWKSMGDAQAYSYLQCVDESWGPFYSECQSKGIFQVMTYFVSAMLLNRLKLCWPAMNSFGM